MVHKLSWTYETAYGNAVGFKIYREDILIKTINDDSIREYYDDLSGVTETFVTYKVIPFRVDLTEEPTANRVRVRAVRKIIPNMTSENEPYGKVSFDSNVLADNHPTWKVFDGYIRGTYGDMKIDTANLAWYADVIYEFLAPEDARLVEFTGFRYDTLQSLNPSTFLIVYGSNDATIGTEIGRDDAVILRTSYDSKRLVHLTTGTSYKKFTFRIEGTLNGSDSYNHNTDRWLWSSLKLYGK